MDITFSLQNILYSDLLFLAEDILNCGYSKPTVSKRRSLIPSESKSSTLHIQKV